MQQFLNRPWVWLFAIAVLGMLTLIAAATVTIEVDEQGNVTVNDPQRRVTLTAGSPPPTNPPHAPTGDAPASSGPVAFPSETIERWKPADAASIKINTAESWRNDTDVLVLAWSEAQNKMVAEFAPRFSSPPVIVTDKHLRALPSGINELQAMWRHDGNVVSIARHRIAIQTDDQAVNTQPNPPNPAPDATGFANWPLHPDARIIHVANAGDDANHGRDPQHPVQTLAHAKTLIRQGFGDQLRLRAGDTFLGGLGQWAKSGRSETHPLVLGVYGEGSRPTILTNGDGLLHTRNGSTVNYVAIQGLRVVAALRDPDQPGYRERNVPYREKGINWLARGEFLHIEDCVFDRFMFHVVLQNSQQHTLRNITLRRNIMIDAWSHWDSDLGGHSSGLFAKNVTGLTIDQCVFDHNGWADDAQGGVRTKFNHNLYIQRDCTNVAVTNNIITRGASYGLQLRPGGRAAGNLFARNAQAMYLALSPSVVARNVMVESDNMTDKPEGRRGYGLETWPIEHAQIEGNLFLHKRGDADWAGAIEITEFGSWSAPVNGYRVTLTNNTIVDWPRNNGKRSIVIRDNSAQVTEHSNTLDRASGGKRAPNFINAQMTLDHAADGSFNHWLENARQRQRGQWAQNATAAYINEQLFDAFRIKSQ